MIDWVESTTHQGYREKTIHYGSATLVIRRPTTDTTLAETQARQTLERVMRDYLHRRVTK